MAPQEKLNAAIAHQIGSLIIENHALKLQVQELQQRVIDLTPPPDMEASQDQPED